MLESRAPPTRRVATNKALHREKGERGEGMLSLALVRGRALDCPHIGQETLMWLTMIP